MSMPHPSSGIRQRPGFTLMEVVVSIGVLAVALSVIIASIGFSSSRGAENSFKALAISLAETAMADVGGALRNQQKRSEIYQITPPEGNAGGRETLYFDVDGMLAPDRGRSFFSCELQFHPDLEVTGLMHVHARVSWPTKAKPGREQGSVGLLTSYSLP
jgi:prepilin-type N-terminal cleavage/methylation domain-containing protein